MDLQVLLNGCKTVLKLGEVGLDGSAKVAFEEAGENGAKLLRKLEQGQGEAQPLFKLRGRICIDGSSLCGAAGLTREVQLQGHRFDLDRVQGRS